jgi:hypothetical protein
MKVLVGCETSGIVRDAFLELGHDAWSCDVLPADTPTNRHMVADVRDVLKWETWDMLIVCHPPCTRLCNSGVRWLHKAPPGRTVEEMWAELDAGAELFSDCWNADVPRVCVENPVMHKQDTIHKAPPGPDRWKIRSKFYPGIAHAMAAQWGGEVTDTGFALAA